MTQAEIVKLVSALVAASVAKPLKTAPKAKAKPAKAAKPKSSRPSKDEMKAQLDVLTKAAFAAKGFTDVQPRVNVLTQKRWNEQGKSVQPGQEPVWVKAPWMTAKQMGYPMFHASQVA